MKRSFLKRRTPLRKSGASKRPKSDQDTVSHCKARIQALLREIVMIRDGGCVLRQFPEEAGACGGYRKDGQLILQAEHLVTRANSISYGDLRNIVCLCQRHHGFFKPQHSRLYWELIEHIVGYKTWDWIKAVEKDKRPHRTTLWDWQKIELSLRQHLTKLQNAVHRQN